MNETKSVTLGRWHDLSHAPPPSKRHFLTAPLYVMTFNLSFGSALYRTGCVETKLHLSLDIAVVDSDSYHPDHRDVTQQVVGFLLTISTFLSMLSFVTTSSP